MAEAFARRRNCAWSLSPRREIGDKGQNSLADGFFYVSLKAVNTISVPTESPLHLSTYIFYHL